jgi:hypothetical protein
MLDLLLMIFSCLNLALYSGYLFFILVKTNCRLFLGLGTVLLLFEVFFISKVTINTLFYL